MRFAFVPFAVLAASLMFAAPTAPTVKNEIVPASFPWHSPKPVQYVTVTNWPAVQTVGGTVNIGNLPLDGAGAVRISSAPPKQMVIANGHRHDGLLEDRGVCSQPQPDGHAGPGLCSAYTMG